MNPEKIPGIDCPRCSKFIQISIAELLAAHNIRCPHCHLQLTINRSQSESALQALRKVEEARLNVEKARNFKR